MEHMVANFDPDLQFYQFRMYQFGWTNFTSLESALEYTFVFFIMPDFEGIN